MNKEWQLWAIWILGILAMIAIVIGSVIRFGE